MFCLIIRSSIVSALDYPNNSPKAFNIIAHVWKTNRWSDLGKILDSVVDILKKPHVQILVTMRLCGGKLWSWSLESDATVRADYVLTTVTTS